MSGRQPPENSLGKPGFRRVPLRRTGHYKLVLSLQLSHGWEINFRVCDRVHDYAAGSCGATSFPNKPFKWVLTCYGYCAHGGPKNSMLIMTWAYKYGVPVELLHCAYQHSYLYM